MSCFLFFPSMSFLRAGDCAGKAWVDIETHLCHGQTTLSPGAWVATGLRRSLPLASSGFPRTTSLTLRPS